MKPLAGVRVVEMGTVVLGPFATEMLADMGATVIKVESLAGDTTRSLGYAAHPGMASLFLNCNRGKRSVALDVKSAAGYSVLTRIVATADVFVHNMRCDTAEKLGVGYARLRATNPRLVYCATYGYGARGRDAQRPAYDDIIQAGSGVAALRGMIDGVPAYAPTIIADKTTALFVVIGVMGALMERSRTGQGRELEVAMLETMAYFVSIEHLNGYTYDPPQAGVGYARLLNAYRRPHRTKDGFLAVMPHNEKQWRKFFTIVDREDVLVDPRFADPASRSRNVDALYLEVSAILPLRTSAEWAELFTRHDVPFGPVNGLDDLTRDPHMADVDFWHGVDHPTEGRLRVPSFPVRDGGPGGDATPAALAPALGEHTVEVLREVGLAASEIDALLAAGVIATHWPASVPVPAAAAAAGGST